MVSEIEAVSQQRAQFEDLLEKIVSAFECADEIVTERFQHKCILLENSMSATIEKAQNHCKEILKSSTKAEQQLIGSKTCILSVVDRVKQMKQQHHNTTSPLFKLPLSYKSAYAALSGSLKPSKPTKPAKPRDVQHKLANSIILKTDLPTCIITLNVNFFPIERSPYDKYEHIHSTSYLRDWIHFTSIEVHPTTGLIFLADPDQRRVIITSRLLQHHKTWCMSDNPRLPRFAPTDISISSCGSYIAIASEEDNSVAVFDNSYQLLLHMNEVRFREHDFQGVHGVAFDANNDIIIAECGEFTRPRVRKFSLNGELLGPVLVSNTENPPKLKRVAVTHDQYVVMATQGSNIYVHSVSPTGEYRSEISTTIRTGHYYRANNITRGPGGGFVVCDENSRRIRLFDCSGEAISEITCYRKPYACCFGPDGVLYVVSNEDRYLIAY